VPSDADFLGLTAGHGPGRYRFTVADHLSRLDGRLYGGTAIAVSVAVSELVSERRALWMTTQFVSTVDEGAEVDVLALASVRATREARVKHEGEELACIMGTPLPGERADGQVFDGETEIAMFPGDLPRDPEKLFEVKNRTLDPSEDRLASQGKHAQNPPVAVVDEDNPLRFVRFRPPRVEKTAGGRELSLPHIRLDRAIEFLIGDRLA